jgi:hypothetical protein
VQTCAAIASCGLAGVGYYAYNGQGATCQTINRAIPEWRCQQAVAQASGLPPAPRCSGDPPDRPGNRVTVPALNFDETLPLSGFLCAAWGMPGGSLGIAVRTSAQVMGTNFVGRTCLEHSKMDLSATARLRVCFPTLQGDGRYYTDYFRHGCKTCVTPPTPSCTGLMCSMATRAVNIGLRPGIEFVAEKSVLGFTFKAGIRLDAPGAYVRGGIHTTRNGTDPQCGDCRREVIDGVSGVDRPDCDRVTIHWPFATGLKVTGGGDATAGPLNARLRVRGELTGNVRYLNESGACAGGGSRSCLLGGFFANGGWDVRAGLNAYSATIARVDCQIQWTAPDCSRGRRFEKTGNCTEPIYPRVRIGGFSFPF